MIGEGLAGCPGVIVAVGAEAGRLSETWVAGALFGEPDGLEITAGVELPVEAGDGAG